MYLFEAVGSRYLQPNHAICFSQSIFTNKCIEHTYTEA